MGIKTQDPLRQTLHVKNYVFELITIAGAMGLFSWLTRKQNKKLWRFL